MLAVQDTTTLNYTAHPATADVEPINTTTDQAVGLIVHDTLAFSGEGTPLGLVLDLQCWARDPAQAGQRETRKARPIEEKESAKWLKSYRAVAELQQLCRSTLLVSVADREGDTHELRRSHTPGGPSCWCGPERDRLRRSGRTCCEPRCWRSRSGPLRVLVPRRKLPVIANQGT